MISQSCDEESLVARSQTFVEHAMNLALFKFCHLCTAKAGIYCLLNLTIIVYVREGTFLIGGGGGGGGGLGYFRNFLQKKSWPSHFPDSINA